MKILNLILYSKSDEYDEMYNLQSNYLKFIKENLNIDYYFYCYDDIEEDYKIIDDIIYIKGEESYLPGVLDKTIKSFELFINDNYDYIIRSNISTVLNFELLINFLNNNKIDYCGNIIKINWLNNEHGITKKYFNEDFITGTCIILSNNAYTYLLNNKINLDYTVIDDIAISLLLKYNFKFIELNNYYVVNDTNVNEKKTFTNDKTYHQIIPFYRNKSINRNNDIQYINILIDDLINNFNNYTYNNSNNCIIIYNDNNDNLQNCCNHIRKYYQEKIIIISNNNIEVDIDNYQVIISKYYFLGIISAYYYFYINKTFNKALIINSSTNIDKLISFDKINKLKPLNINNDISFTKLDELINWFSLSNELDNFIDNKQIQYIDSEIIINWNVLDLINKRHNFFNVLLNNIVFINYNKIVIELLIGSMFNKYI